MLVEREQVQATLLMGLLVQMVQVGAVEVVQMVVVTVEQVVLVAQEEAVAVGLETLVPVVGLVVWAELESGNGR